MELLTRNNFESWMQKLMERIDRQDELLLSLQPSGKAPNPIERIRMFDNQDLCMLLQMHYHHGSFIVLLPLLAAWGADTCALFSGMLFGKHKLAPVVSPKKTVEGAVGGVVGGAVLVLIAAVIMNRTLDLEMPLWSAVVLGAVGAVLGEIGDLSFSVIKRQTGIKDYGHIFPGHGGVLDRFDSVLFVAPFAELLFRIIW